jgi:hypothetical protein
MAEKSIYQDLDRFQITGCLFRYRISIEARPTGHDTVLMRAQPVSKSLMFGFENTP